MRLPARSVGWLLPLFLTGCVFHHTHQPPHQQLAPALPPRQPMATTPVELPESAGAIQPNPVETAEAPTEKVPKHHSRHRKPADATEDAANSTPELPAPPAVSAIGQLSSGDPAAYRNETSESIDTVERGLNSIYRSLSASEQKTADQIREFLKEARAALTSGDVDGAHTLAVKAKVLLDELTK